MWRPFSILAVGSFPQTTQSLPESVASSPPFSILAVGSFPQTKVEDDKKLDKFPFSILAVGSFPQTSELMAYRIHYATLSVSSLLDRFLRRLPGTPAVWDVWVFQYPRCWIVSSDASRTCCS